MNSVTMLPCFPLLLQLPGLEVWFQRATDVVRKLVTGDIDIGIVGYDMLCEIGNDDPGES